MATTRTERVVLIALALFTGVMAIVGTIGLLGSFWSEGLPTDMLKGSPFSSYLIPALALFFLVGGSSFLTAFLLIEEHPLGDLASALAGGILVIFEIVEYLVIGLTMFLQPLMFAIGIIIIATAALRARAEYAPY